MCILVAGDHVFDCTEDGRRRVPTSKGEPSELRFRVRERVKVKSDKKKCTMRKRLTPFLNRCTHEQVLVEFWRNSAAAMDFVERDAGEVVVLNMVPVARVC